MFTNLMKRTAMLAVVLVAAVVVMAGCAKKYEALDTGVSGEITYVSWSGDGSPTMFDIGHQELTADDLPNQVYAALYATAKEFNKIYPNVKINVWAREGNAGEDWRQELENFKAEHGSYPDIYKAMDLAGDLASGLVADLSVFKEDPQFKKLNQKYVEQMNFYGFQAGLPDYIFPYGIFINKELAEQNNIDVPGPDWTIDEYTAFVASADNKTFWGDMDTPSDFIDLGTLELNYKMATYSGKGDHVSLDSDAIKDLLSYIPRWAKTAVRPQNESGKMPEGVMNEYWWWGHKFFIENKLLVNSGDPWMIGDAASIVENNDLRVKSGDWDFYPAPTTKYNTQTTNIVVDPIGFHNYAMDDGNPEWSEEEKAKLQLAYTFAMFMISDDAAWKARSEQQFFDGTAYRSAINDSLPVVTGEDFTRQMEYWYASDSHIALKDAARFPGFHRLMEIYSKGEITAINTKAYPYRVEENGTMIEAWEEWWYLGDPETVGAMRTDANWLDLIKAKLPDWNTKFNARFQQADQDLRNGLTRWYGFTEKDFK